MNSPLNEFTIRPYKEGDEVKINKAFNHIFRLKRTLSNWRWKFMSPNDSRIMMAFDSSENLMTHYSLVTSPFQYNGDEYIAGQSLDTFSKRSQKAIHARLLEKVTKRFFQEFGHSEDVSLMYGFPSKRILRLGQLRLDYGKPIPIKYWKKINYKPSLKNLFVKSRHSPDMEKIDDLWERSKKRYPVSIIRDSKWFRNRYFSKPDHSYRFVQISHDGIYSAIAVYVIFKNRIEIIDWIWDGKHIQSIRDLLELVQKSNWFFTKKILTFWLKGDQILEKELERLNWELVDHPLDLFFVVNSFNSNIDRLDVLDKFYLTKGCTDII